MNSRLCNLILFFAVFTIGVSACTSQKLKTTKLIIESGGGAVEMTVEIAQTDEERSRGLMFRKKLPDGRGMLFVFERDQQLSFWMKNTLIPLSIAFIASDGRIIEIKDMQPLNENTVKSSRSVRYALEVPQHWFSRAGIQAGDRVNMDF
jgi:uncharacterized membrane protein (UPF0127 family)